MEHDLQPDHPGFSRILTKNFFHPVQCNVGFDPRFDLTLIGMSNIYVVCVDNTNIILFSSSEKTIASLMVYVPQGWIRTMYTRIMNSCKIVTSNLSMSAMTSVVNDSYLVFHGILK